MGSLIEMEESYQLRLNKEQRKALEKKYGVDRIWSFSRLQTFHNCIQEYVHLYLRHDVPRTDNVYTIFGSEVHDITEGLTKKEFDLTSAKSLWDNFVKRWENDPDGLRFDTEKIKQGYIGNLSHYFTHTNIPEGSKFHTELPVMTKVGGTKEKPHYVFVGYIDTEYIDKEGNVVLVDYKSSSKSSFSKSKLPEKSMQLMLYSIGIHQQENVPYEKIKARFDMMKYVTVHYKQENGKWNTSVQERSIWVLKMQKKLETKLKKLGIDKEKARKLIQIASLANNMDNLPKEVQDQFYITNYYIELDINEKDCNALLRKIEKQCDEITELEQLSPDAQDSFADVNHHYNPDDYYDKKLCAYHTSAKFLEQEKTLIGEPQSEFKIENKDNGVLDLFKSDNKERTDETLMKELFA